jgi:peptide/nickel transport system permease protein
MLGSDATKEKVEFYRQQLWLDRPLFVQYWHWLSNAFQGDLGNSIMFQDKVANLLVARLPVTIYLSFLALILSTVLGVITGIISAIRRGSALDSFMSLFANAGIAIPSFWLGLIGMYLFGLKLGWLPTTGYTSPFNDLGKSLMQAIMPVFCLAVPAVAVISRQTRSCMLEVIRQDYIRTAYSKGITEMQILLKHALKNALIPVVTILGLQVRILIGGSVLIETVFNIPGMGRLLVNAAFDKDFPIVQGGVLLMSLIVCLINLLVDISYGWFDPRIRYG